jgi:hypothetical protein
MAGYEIACGFVNTCYGNNPARLRAGAQNQTAAQRSPLNHDMGTEADVVRKAASVGVSLFRETGREQRGCSSADLSLCPRYVR